GPADGLQRAVRQANIVNQKDTDRQEDRSEDKEPGQTTPDFFREGDPGLNQRQQQREIAKSNQMNVRVYLGAAVFEKLSDALEMRGNRCAIAGLRRLGGSSQAGAYARRILVQDKDGKKVAKDHSHQNHADPGEGKQPARTQRGKAHSIQWRRG